MDDLGKIIENKSEEFKDGVFLGLLEGLKMASQAKEAEEDGC